jgi:cytidylate kinase
MCQKLVITIARQLGSGGSCIAQSVARRLGYAFIDRQILQRAAEELGIEEAELEGREERTERLWEKMLSGFMIYGPPPHWVIDTELAKVERRLITELAIKGPSCVILGHGAFQLLQGKVPLLNIMVHAPLPFRVERVMSIYHAENRDLAIKIIERSDEDRGRYIRAFTGQDWFDIRNYDLAIDTGAVDFAEAEEMIVSVACRLRADELLSVLGPGDLGGIRQGDLPARDGDPGTRFLE